MAKRYTREEQKHHIAHWRKSGVSQKAYCAQNGLSWSTFKNWSKRQKPPAIETPFAPIQITPSTNTQWIIESSDGLRVHVPAYSDENSLKILINALRSSNAA